MAQNTIEQDVLDHMSVKLTEPVYMERPLSPEAEYVLIEKTGNGKRESLCTATFAMQSLAGSLLQTCELNERVKAAAESLIELDRVVKASVITDYNFTDTARKEYRYQAVVQVVHY